MNRLCARFCVADYVVEAFRWTVLSARVRFLLALPLGLAAASLAIPILIVPVWIVSSVVLALTVYQPFLSDQQLPRDLKSVSGATRGLLRLTLVALAYVGISLGGWWLIRQSTEPILYVASVFWYVLEFSVDALLLASAIYGFGLIRGLADLRRFFSIRYLVTWLRLDYFMALAALWLAPPIVLLAFFMWFAYPAIRFQAQVNGESVSFWLRLMAGTADAFSKFGILSLMPAAFVLGTLLHAKIVSELERDVIQIRG